MKRLLISLQILIWVSGLLFINWPSLNLSLGLFRTQDGTMLIGTLWGTLINMIIFYGNAIILLPRLVEVNLKKYIYSALGLFVLFSSLESVVDLAYLHYSQPQIGFFNSAEQIENTFFNLIFLVWSFNFVFFLISMGYGFSKIWIKNKEHQMALKEERLASELAFLKNQINPHFLFNTLNNLFALSRRNGDLETSSQIAKLAKLMRYMLYETDTNFVPISREIEYLENYIELQKLRFSETDDVHIILDWGNKDSNYPIAPFILLPFIENAFKFGISLQNKSTITISIQHESNLFRFTVSNTIHKHIKHDTFGGIGLQNLKKRLRLLYPDNHLLDIQKKDESYTAILELQNG